MALRRGSRPERPERPERSARWLAWFAAAPGLAALVGVGATLATVHQAGKQLTLAEEGQYTTRFNEATKNLGAEKRDVAIGGIYAFDRIMHDSEKDQPGVIAVLTAYARENSAVPMTGTFTRLSGRIPELRPDISAVVSILAARPQGKDGRAQVDLTYTDLHNLRLVAYRVDETQNQLTKGGAKPELLHLGPVNLNQADLRFARIVRVDLDKSFLGSANLTCLFFTDTTLLGSNLEGAKLDLVNWLEVKLGDKADLSGARLRGATLEDVDLSHADLRNTELCDTTFKNVNFTGADLRGAKLKGARFVNSTGTPPANSLSCQDWPLPAPITPDGTVVDTQPFTEQSRHAHCKYPVDMQ
ncbi:pentapeptide repeat-containing protein [Streptomyces sp. NPDC058049]|uniref:pentapeptide repeat-containing protein n=1 Tax=Streptomyces sp. NPDC058049 TaxID=3346314 RepID=UPI0036E5FF0F